jgi:5-methylcytosine-specific restriction endonuclease McrA
MQEDGIEGVLIDVYAYNDIDLSFLDCIKSVGIDIPIETAASRRDRHVMGYAKWRKAVFTRDNFRCRECGSEENLEAHHIKPFSAAPELMYVVENGLTLCKDCHKKTDSYARKKGKRAINGLSGG